MKFYFYENGRRLGPFEAEKLIGFAVEGRILPETIVETESGKALPASKVKGLFFESPNALPPSPPIFSQRAETGNSPWKEIDYHKTDFFPQKESESANRAKNSLRILREYRLFPDCVFNSFCLGVLGGFVAFSTSFIFTGPRFGGDAEVLLAFAVRWFFWGASASCATSFFCFFLRWLDKYGKAFSYSTDRLIEIIEESEKKG